MCHVLNNDEERKLVYGSSLAVFLKFNGGKIKAIMQKKKIQITTRLVFEGFDGREDS